MRKSLIFNLEEFFLRSFTVGLVKISCSGLCEYSLITANNFGDRGTPQEE